MVHKIFKMVLDAYVLATEAHPTCLYLKEI